MDYSYIPLNSWGPWSLYLIRGKFRLILRMRYDFTWSNDRAKSHILLSSSGFPDYGGFLIAFRAVPMAHRKAPAPLADVLFSGLYRSPSPL